VVLAVTAALLPSGIGRMKSTFSLVFSNRPAINWPWAVRFFLSGSRGVWFVAGLPVFAYSVMGWSFTLAGTRRPDHRCRPPPQTLLSTHLVDNIVQNLGLLLSRPHRCWYRVNSVNFSPGQKIRTNSSE
jgi:hypothetical protein